MDADDAAEPAAGAQLDARVRGRTATTLGVLIAVQAQRAGVDAIAFAERLSMSVRLQSIRSLFTDSGLAFQRVLNMVEVGSIYQQRVHSAVQMDVALNVVTELADTAETYIETLRYETEFLGADENPVAHQLADDLDLIP